MLVIAPLFATSFKYYFGFSAQEAFEVDHFPWLVPLIFVN